MSIVALLCRRLLVPSYHGELETIKLFARAAAEVISAPEKRGFDVAFFLLLSRW